MTITYYFTYTYGNGDYYTGTGYASASLGYYNGLTWYTANETGNNGYYTITGVADWGYDNSWYEGQVFAQSYYDSESNTLASHLTPVAGYGVSGLGSEYSYMANNANYTPYDTFGWHGYYEADFIYEGAVRDSGRGEGTPQNTSSFPEDPTDYNTPGDGGVNEWGSSSDDGGPWLSTANIGFLNGQTTAYLPIDVSNDGMADGNNTIIWSISDSAPFGFTQETYIINESVDPIITDFENDFDYATVTDVVGLSVGSQIKTASIIIQDANSFYTPIFGDGNNNVLASGDANDIVYAQAGNDYVYATNGNDSLYGEAGDDTLSGESGNDYLNAASGNDYLYGGADDDKLDGLSGDDALLGESGNDSLLGWYGNDYLDGGDGDDSLDGEADNDAIIGGLGNDTLIGVAGSNVLFGGVGDDNYTVASSDAITEYFNEGTDTVRCSGINFTLGDNLENLLLEGSSAVTGVGNALNNYFEAFYGNNFLYGVDGNDTFLCGYGNTLIGGTGADKFAFTYTYNNGFGAGIDNIADFAYWDGDKIEVSADTFGIGLNEYSRFAFDSNTGALFFDQTQIAALQLGSGFTPSLDITIV